MSAATEKVESAVPNSNSATPLEPSASVHHPPKLTLPAPENQSITTSNHVDKVMTPGPNVPGAFPPESEQEQHVTLGDLKPNVDTQAIVERAKEMIPARDDIATAAQSVVQTAANFLPASLTNTVSGFLCVSIAISPPAAADLPHT